MEEDVSIQQIIEGIKDYIHYKPKLIYQDIIINEPNLYDQNIIKILNFSK